MAMLRALPDQISLNTLYLQIIFNFFFRVCIFFSVAVKIQAVSC